MRLTILKLFKLLRPLNKINKRRLEQLEKYLGKTNISQVKRLIKLNIVGFSYISLGVSSDLIKNSDYVQLQLNMDEKNDKDIQRFVRKVNKEIENISKENMFKRFSINADKIIPKLIAPNITDMETIKAAAALQLFSKERTHILLLGDPGTGKTDIMRSVSDLSPISSLGLGSGTTNAGLSLSIKGKEIFKGLLPLADKGMCCIDELNLMKSQDMASLYSAMEKGFITYDKAKNHIKMNARVKILATANPKGDKFVGWIISTLKKQIPFDSALLSRFHLVFLIRKPSIKEFEQIAKKIVSNRKEVSHDKNVSFVKEYIDYVKNFEVSFPKVLEQKIVEFAKNLKIREHEFLIDISPRIVHGIIRFAKASARMNMRSQVINSDIIKVINIFEKSLIIKRI